MTSELSPCLYCSRVPDPKSCENKKCRVWQNWFSKAWEQARRQFRTPFEQATVQPTGVPLGGHRYVSTHRVREYLQKEPCEGCKLPRELCNSPCPVYRAWEDRKEQVKNELEG